VMAVQVAVADLAVGWALHRFSDGQPSSTSAVLASPSTGPAGRANPIQNAASAGSSASASTAPARLRCHNNHPAMSSATQTSRNKTSKGTVV
jgi:hypothetical protein